MSCSQLLEPNLPMSRWKPSTSATWLFGFAGHEPGADSLELPEREKPCARGAPCQKRGTFSQLQKDSTRRPVWGCRCSCKLGICACALRKERGRENRERERRGITKQSPHGWQPVIMLLRRVLILFNKTRNTQRKLNQKLPLNVWLWVLKLRKLQDLHVAGICI
jgi:hypothetical protein